MEKKDIKKIGLVFGMILIVAVGLDLSQGEIKEDGTILRNDVGEEDKEVELQFDINGVGTEYDYLLNVEPVRVKEEQAQKYLSSAIQEIEIDFASMEDVVPIKEEYLEGLVDAEWNMDPWNVIEADGTIVQEKIPEDGIIVNATVTLICGEYEQIYQFPFELVRKELSKEEMVHQALESWMETEMSKEGEKKVLLPTQLEGFALHWSEKKESLTIKIFLLEIVAVIVLILAERRKKGLKRKELERKLELDYPEIVGQLTLLLGAGMNMRQVWNKIATRYSEKREKEQICLSPAFEGILRMNRRIQEGENEKAAYQMFANEMQNMNYHRLIRLLIGNLEKGSGGICNMLEQESNQAYAQRVLHAKKLGEEASTRMLAPLMLMMIVVMAVVMMPAIVGFMG